MSNITGKLGKLALYLYLGIAFFVGLDRSGHPGSGVMAILQGCLWPIQLLVAAIRAA